MLKKGVLVLVILLTACSQGNGNSVADATNEEVPDIVVEDQQREVSDTARSLTDLAGTDENTADVQPEVSIPDLPAPAEVSDTTFPPDLTDVPDVAEPLPEVADLAEESETTAEVLAEVVDLPFEYAWQPQEPCGMTAYEWLLPDQVGHVVSFEEKPLYNLTPELIKLLVQEAGYNLVFDLPYGCRVFSMRYTTQDRGVVREATAMVGFPDVGPEDVDGLLVLPVASFLHGTAGFADQCAPSMDIEGAAAAVLPAASGFIAVAPDFLGLCGYGGPCDDMFHPYLIGEPTALASLDAVRAALELLDVLQEDIPVASDGRLMPWGISQGGHAALFVHRYAQTYAPEFDMPCVIAVVPPANLVGQAAVALAGFGSAAGMGLGFMLASYLWYEPDEGLDTLLNAEGPKNYPEYSLETFQTTCSSGKLYSGAVALEDLYAAPFLETMATEGFASYLPWGCFGLENSLPTATPPIPETATDILWVMGENDEIVNTPVARETYETLCDQGYRLQHIECAGKKHTPAALDSFSLQLEWALSCMDGNAIAQENLCVLNDPQECKL